MNLREMFRERADQPDSAYAWLRLSIAVLIGMIGGVGMWSVPVALPAVQADFGVDRAAASLPYTLTMVGFAVSGVGLGRLVDRFGISIPLRGGRSSDRHRLHRGEFRAEHLHLRHRARRAGWWRRRRRSSVR